MTLLEREPAALHPDLLSVEERLSQDAYFSLDGTNLVDPNTNRGSVVDVKACAPISMAGEVLPTGVQVYEIHVQDPFVDADPATYTRVEQHVTKLEALVRAEGFDPLEERRKEHPYMKEGESTDDSKGRRNKFTDAWLHQADLAPLGAWHSNVPTAEALGYLTNPCVDCEIIDSKGNPITSTPETAAFLRFVDDAVAIRDRGTAMQEIAETHLRGLERGQSVRWLSLASGTAEPSIAAGKAVHDEVGLQVDLTVADINRKSLEFVQGNAERYGFGGNITTVRANILNPEFPEKLAQKTGSTKLYDVVENMGFEEYLPEAGDENEMGAYLDMGLPSASEFTKNAYALVKPGGVLISGNMVLDRPQRDFVFGIVDWPIINARSEESILRIYEKAGVPMDQVSLFRVRNSQTGKHVYDIVMVKKPSNETEQ